MQQAQPLAWFGRRSFVPAAIGAAASAVRPEAADDDLTLQPSRAAGPEEDSLSRELSRRETRGAGLATISNRLFTRLGLLSGADLSDSHAPPRYLREIAEAQGIDVSEHHGGLPVEGQHSSQKTLPSLDRIADLQAAAGIDADRRPQTVSVEEWMALLESLGPLE